MEYKSKSSRKRWNQRIVRMCSFKLKIIGQKNPRGIPSLGSVIFHLCKGYLVSDGLCEGTYERGVAISDYIYKTQLLRNTFKFSKTGLTFLSRSGLLKTWALIPPMCFFLNMYKSRSHYTSINHTCIKPIGFHP